MDSLQVNCYTDNLPERSDIITLVQHYKEISFPKAMHYICEVCGYEYYAGQPVQKEDLDPCLAFLESIDSKSKIHNEVPLRKIDESVLEMYLPYPHMLLDDEGISLETQKIFEIGYSVRDNCITIPIRDEIGSLVGVKGRTTLDYKRLKIPKYWYPVSAPKSQILYGLDKTYEHIIKSGKVFVFEAEKSVQKAWSYGFKNSVSVGGHELSEYQVNKIERLGVEVILALDNNISPQEVKEEAAKFLFKDKVSAIIPYKNNNILGEKDAPVDHSKEFFELLLNEDIYRVPV